MRLPVTLKGEKIAVVQTCIDWDLGRSILSSAVLSVHACVHVYARVCLCTYACTHTHAPLQTSECLSSFLRGNGPDCWCTLTFLPEKSGIWQSSQNPRRDALSAKLRAIYVTVQQKSTSFVISEHLG